MVTWVQRSTSHLLAYADEAITSFGDWIEFGGALTNTTSGVELMVSNSVALITGRGTYGVEVHLDVTTDTVTDDLAWELTSEPSTAPGDVPDLDTYPPAVEEDYFSSSALASITVDLSATLTVVEDTFVVVQFYGGPSWTGNATVTVEATSYLRITGD